MADQGDGVWFRRTTRRWGYGYNFVPVTWQGWVMTVALAPVVLATVFAGDPSMAKQPSSFAFFVKTKALFGLNGVHLSPLTVAALIVGESLGFLFLILWKTRALKPLD
jgi:hypothetical protein